MNLAQLRAAVRIRVGVPASDALYTDAVLTGLVNAAIHHIEGVDDWRWLELEEMITATNGVATYPLPDRYRSSLFVATDQGFELELGTAAQHRLLRGASGAPKVWGVYGAQLRVAPTPNASYTLTHAYVAGELDLVADTDQPFLPVVWRQAVVEYAAYLGMRRWGQLADAGSALEAFESWLARMPRSKAYSESTGGGNTPPVVLQREVEE